MFSLSYALLLSLLYDVPLFPVFIVRRLVKGPLTVLSLTTRRTSLFYIPDIGDGASTTQLLVPLFGLHFDSFLCYACIANYIGHAVFTVQSIVLRMYILLSLRFYSYSSVQQISTLTV
jgi:hypothetical protein